MIREIYPDRLSIDATDVDPMLTRLTKGLLCAILKLPLPLSVPIEAHMLLGYAGPETLSFFVKEGFKHRRVGADFEFWYGFSIEGFGGY